MKINLTALIIVTVSTIGAAAMVFNKQPRDAWTFELDVRPDAETW